MGVGISLCTAQPSSAIAQTVPGAADAGRVGLEGKTPILDSMKGLQITAPSTAPTLPVPEGAEDIHFVLKGMQISGATVFSDSQLAESYAPYLNQDITLAAVYKIADAITARYREAGYFLSLAYLPDQSSGEGIITLKIVEGYIGKVELPEAMKNHGVVQAYIDRLTMQRPISAQALESFLLRLNDLPGYGVSGTISTLEDSADGAVKLTLEATGKTGTGSIVFDNFSSRYLGPNELAATYSKSLIPLQQSTISGLTSMPMDEVNYAALSHAIAIAPDITLGVAGEFTRARPGYTLQSFEIESRSTFLGLSLDYQWVRQRQKNLSLHLSLGGRNTDSDLLGTPLTRDRIRTLRLGANYNAADNWRGRTFIGFKLTQGIDGFGSSDKGDQNLSRAQAKPDFTKAEFSVARLQDIHDDWSLLAAVSGQIASGPLFSAEEFGYGGQRFGRAFDASEITGDAGIAGSLELRYGGWQDWKPVSLSPFLFYDIGTVWNKDIAQVKRESGASAGFGVRAATDFGLSGDFGLAWPLARHIAAPIYGQDKSGPRILLRVTKDF